MLHNVLQKSNGRYFVDIDITVNEWAEMLQDRTVFADSAMKMVLYWYLEEDHQATSKAIMNKYCNSSLKRSPYNGIVIGLSKRILKHLKNRFWVEASMKNGMEYSF